MGKLSEKFGMPPFSVFDARQGVWQDRKRWWISIGIQSELGRGENAVSIYDQEWCAINAPNKVIHPKSDNGLLGISEQARSHYRGSSVATAINGHGLCDTLAPRPKTCAPGGSLRPVCDYSNKERGDGKGRPIKSPVKMGGNPASTDHGLLIEDIDIHQSKEHSRDFARCFGQDLMKGENDNFGKRLTWVSGERPFDQLDDVSKKILMSGSKQTHVSGCLGNSCLAIHAYDSSGPGNQASQSGTSIFDPVLCELIYKWFVPINGTVLDPFAGGSVRGIVANYLGYHYTGIDLRPEQIAANNIQADNILKDQEKPTWIVGDSKNIDDLIPETTFDLCMSCHPASVHVLTVEHGPISIKDVVVGDHVISHKGLIQQVTECISRKYSGNLYEINHDYRDVSLLVTNEHPLLIKRFYTPDIKTCACGCGKKPICGHYIRGHNNKKSYNGQWGNKTSIGQRTYDVIYASRTETISWELAKDVVINDYLMEPIPIAPISPIDGNIIWEYTPITKKKKGNNPYGNQTVYATADISRLVGYYLAEGWANNRGVGFAFHVKETDYHADVERLYHDTFGQDLKVSGKNYAGNTYTIHCSNTIAGNFFKTMGGGVGASKKRIPDWIWQCSDDIAKEVIKGMWRGDGWICTEDGDLGYSSVSEWLIEDLRRLLLRLGIIASIRTRIGKKNSFCKKSDPLPAWNLAVCGVHAEKLAHILDIEITRPSYRKARRGPFIANGYVHYKIRNIKATTVKDLAVYNLEVENDHSYLADGVSSHNCPPYYNLELYSDDKNDISNCDSYESFIDDYNYIIQQSVNKLKDNRFACFVVGDIRDKSGYYRGFVWDTINAFQSCGMKLYNDAVLITAVGSLPIRVGRQFEKYRKLGKTHQNVLIFYKGDTKKIPENFSIPESVQTYEEDILSFV